MSIPLVLIVDDEPGLLRLFSGLVERLDCETLQASGGVAALNILEQEVPDLLILDLAMPEVSGHEVLQHVRSMPHLDSMKVMILTARPNMVPEIEELGIDLWVSKPIMPQDFLDAVETLLDSHHYQ
ncbi:MAG: response regulator [Anaerolineae bacterium]|nr:response regulator [Anaerolineae bacterium]